MLIQLEAADIVRRRGVGRAAEERGKAPDVTNVVLPRVGAETPHEHVVLHALAEWRNGCIDRRDSHGEFLSLKGTPWSDRCLHPLKQMPVVPLQNKAPLPRSGFVHGDAKPTDSLPAVSSFTASRE